MIDKNIVSVVKLIHNSFPDLVFGGSLSLVHQGLLDRTVMDIDVMKSGEEEFGFFPKNRTWKYRGSMRFQVDALMCTSESYLFYVTESVKIGRQVKVDLIYQDRLVPFKELDFYGEKIKFETADSVCWMKKVLLIDGNNNPKKHFKDLINMGVPLSKEEMIQIIDKI